MRTNDLIIDGLDQPVTVKSHPRAKRLTLRVDARSGVVKVTTPWRTSQKQVANFVTQHLDWINNQTVAQESITYACGMTIPFQGRSYTIQHKMGSGVKIDVLESDRILLFTGKADRLPRSIERFLKKTAREQITTLAHQKAELSGKTINRIAIKDTMTRWGSASSKKNLNFSWRLVLAPDYVLDYVVGHEVAHLTHMNHSTDFWILCDQLSDDMGLAKRWLKKHGRELQRYG